MTTTETAINAKVHELIQRQVAAGQQIGVQVAAYRNGAVAVTLNKMQNSLQGEGPTLEICRFIRSELELN